MIGMKFRFSRSLWVQPIVELSALWSMSAQLHLHLLTAATRAGQFHTYYVGHRFGSHPDSCHKSDNTGQSFSKRRIALESQFQMWLQSWVPLCKEQAFKSRRTAEDT